MNELENDGNELMDELMDETPRKGTFVHEDDLEVGQLLCVHSIKGCNDAAPIMGQSLVVTSVCLPYFTATLYTNPQELLTLDVRFLRMMKVTKEFAEAQKKVQKRSGPQN